MGTGRQLSVLLSGGGYFEAPGWHEGAWRVSDFYRRQVSRVTVAGDGQVAALVEGRPSGLGWLPDGSLVIASMLDQRVLRLTDGSSRGPRGAAGDVQGRRPGGRHAVIPADERPPAGLRRVRRLWWIAGHTPVWPAIHYDSRPDGRAATGAAAPSPRWSGSWTRRPGRKA
jgi:hypothetical protein